ncbi:MAG: hypothetical protein HOP11_04650 [Saprospiraceae bacterium]|nr:hypothetical protein [Saprospiraceae bacterium]
MKKTTWTDHIRDMENTKTPKVPERIWENVIPHLPKGEKRNRKPIWLFFPLLLGAGMVAYYFYNSNPLDDKKGIQNSQNVSSVSTIENETKELTSLNLSNTKESESKNINVEKNQSEIKISKKLNSAKNHRSQDHLMQENKNIESASIQNQIVVKTVSHNNIDNRSIANNSIEQESEASLNVLPTKVTSLLSYSNVSLDLPLKGECYDFNGRRKAKFSVDVYAGPQYSPFTFSTNVAEYNYLKLLREDTESEKVSMLAGVRIGIQNKKWNVKAGLEYQNIYYQLNYFNGNDTIINTRTINGTIVVTDTVFGRRTIKHHNNHHMFNLPISIGYQVNRKENSIQFNVGASLNLFMRSNGAVLDPLLRPAQFNSPLNIYKSAVGISPFFNIQWSGPIMHNLRYYVEPQIQLHPTFTNSSYSLDQKFSSYQLKFGLQYLFQ